MYTNLFVYFFKIHHDKKRKKHTRLFNIPEFQNLSKKYKLKLNTKNTLEKIH